MQHSGIHDDPLQRGKLTKRQEDSTPYLTGSEAASHRGDHETVNKRGSGCPPLDSFSRLAPSRLASTSREVFTLSAAGPASGDGGTMRPVFDPTLNPDACVPVASLQQDFYVFVDDFLGYPTPFYGRRPENVSWSGVRWVRRRGRGARADGYRTAAVRYWRATDRRLTLPTYPPSSHETLFTVEATPFKFGPGAAADAGWEAARLGMRRALVVLDPALAGGEAARGVLDSLRAAGVDPVVFTDVRVEPDLYSLERAATAAREVQPDGFVALGGGSTIDTAKVANLLLMHGGAVMDWVNPPIGGGRAVPGPLRPLLAIPTTPGSGSEATTVAILDLPDLGVKSGISHRSLRPAQALVDPELTRTAPASVIASAGLDVVCHAAESLLSRPYTSRPRPATPDQRPPYQGSNPVADLWSAQALRYGGQYLRRAVADPDDLEARGFMMLSATMAGVGFGSAGVHIPHACAYPIAGLRHSYHAPGYPQDHAFVPHGFSVIVTAPAAFRFTFGADPAKHVLAAGLLTGQTYEPGDVEALPDALLALLRDVGAPDSLSQFGYSEADLPALVAGAQQQQRLLAVAPRLPTAADLEGILRASLG
jgi:hydroxyacid-oxoacid transhydrogenase